MSATDEFKKIAHNVSEAIGLAGGVGVTAAGIYMLKDQQLSLNSGTLLWGGVTAAGIWTVGQHLVR